MTDSHDPAALQRSIELHVAGATIRHASPFASLSVPTLAAALDRPFLEAWVHPFYLDCMRPADHINETPFMTAVARIWPKLTEPVVVTLLSEFNWRPRLAAAIFAALKNFTSVEDHIGRLLLRSDVCYSGNGYCLYLARNNTATATRFLTTYLDYYLTRPDLDFNQDAAMGALAYGDRRNGTNVFGSYMPRWEEFLAAQCRHYSTDYSAAEGHRKMAKCNAQFELDIAAINRLATQMSDGAVAPS